ncbi:MAG: hypothetical protein ACJA0V_004284 [Planctomycetota bacterium]|jgi:hypothetical protein
MALPMSVRIFVVIALAFATIALAYWLWSAESLPMPSAGTGEVLLEQASPKTNAETAPAATHDANDSLADANRTVIDSDEPRTATVTGRCVDASGNALLGAAASIYGYLERGERGKLWLSTHDTAPVWTNAIVLKTGAGGRFSISFVPPPPFAFTLTLTLRTDGLVATHFDWDAIDPGSVIDVGDVKLGPGITLRGRVIDSRGAPMAKASVRVQPKQDGTTATDATAADGERSMRIRLALATTFRSAGDGTFLASTSLPEGTYTIYVSGEELVSPPTIGLSLQERDHALEIVVKSLADIPHVSGRVLDDHEEPVANVEVGTPDTDQIGRFETRTRRDGTFLLRANTTPKAATIPLVVRAQEHECNVQPVEVAWGTEDVTLRVVRGAELTVRVTDPQQRAIERFTVRMVPRERGGYGSDDGRVRAEGRHQDGIAVVPGLLRGKWLIVVDFPDRPGADVLMAPLQVDTIRATRVDLVRQPSAERVVSVVLADGSPVAGTSVSACDLFGSPWNTYRSVMNYETWLFNAGAPQSVLRVASATTDAQGRARLRGPGGREYLLQAESETHLPKLVESVRLDIPGELRIVVQAGASLHGRIEPLTALDELRRLAGLKPGESFGARAPFLTLAAAEGHGRFPSPSVYLTGNQPLAIADDGAFAAGGLPLGAWHVSLNGQGTQASVGSVTLIEGQTSELIVKIPWLLPGTLEGTVLWNGAPFADRPVTLVSAGHGRHLQATTDSTGKFTVQAAKGRYSLEMSVSSEQRAISLTAPETVDVTSGETATCEFHATSGRVRLRVLDPDGAPLSRLMLMATRPGETFRYQPATGADGEVELQLPPGTWSFAIFPKRIDNREDRTRIRREGQAAGIEDPLAEHRLLLGELVVQAGADQRLELRLPPEWLR